MLAGDFCMQNMEFSGFELLNQPQHIAVGPCLFVFELIGLTSGQCILSKRNHCRQVEQLTGLNKPQFLSEAEY